MSADKAWYRKWFGSPYYNLLYKHRDEEEAAAFIDHLLDYFSPAPKARMLDAACGNGRHATYLHQKGYDVTGIDLSKQQITEAQKNEEDGLRFFVYDMRYPFKQNHYDYVFNFFTSFGYFADERDNIRTLKAFQHELKPNGKLMLDFLNVHKAAQELIEQEKADVEGVQFRIKRQVTDQFIIKKIAITDDHKYYNYQEKVQRLTLDEFKRYFSKTTLEIRQLFGNYQLDDFDENRSDRLIIIAEKQ